MTRILADRLARVTARAERAEAQVERVRAVVRDWAAATCIADGAPCSFHRQSPEHASDVRAALAETETGHQTRSEAPRSAEEPELHQLSGRDHRGARGLRGCTCRDRHRPPHPDQHPARDRGVLMSHTLAARCTVCGQVDDPICPECGTPSSDTHGTSMIAPSHDRTTPPTDHAAAPTSERGA